MFHTILVLLFLTILFWFDSTKESHSGVPTVRKSTNHYIIALHNTSSCLYTTQNDVTTSFISLNLTTNMVKKTTEN